MSYQIIFHSGDYKKVDSEVETYEQALEVRNELSNQMYAFGERNFYYEIKEVKTLWKGKEI